MPEVKSTKEKEKTSVGLQRRHSTTYLFSSVTKVLLKFIDTDFF